MSTHCTLVSTLSPRYPVVQRQLGLQPTFRPADGCCGGELSTQSCFSAVSAPWVAAEDTGLGDGKHPQPPDSQESSCLISLAQTPQLRADFQLFPSPQPRKELEKGSSPTLLCESTKLSFSLAKLAFFFPRADSPAQSKCVACSTGPLLQKQELTNCIFVL